MALRSCPRHDGGVCGDPRNGGAILRVRGGALSADLEEAPADEQRGSAWRLLPPEAAAGVQLLLPELTGEAHGLAVESYLEALAAVDDGFVIVCSCGDTWVTERRRS
jgi:hypothetical protein